jgi:hypothetical protein
MFWSCDRTGFPVLELPQLGWAVHLLPVTKVQWERFLAEPGGFGDAWYEEVLQVSPRLSLSKANASNYEQLFMGGILPQEAESFGRWLGKDFQLPTSEVWRSIDQSLAEETITDEEADALCHAPVLHRNAQKLLDFLIRIHKPRSWADLALMRAGLLEWVRGGPKTFGGLGMPRYEFHPLLMNPQQHPPVKPLRVERLRYFGCRLVRPLENMNE